METKKRDMKKFSKIVNSNKNSVRGETAMLKVDGEEYSGDGQVLSGFFKYHQEACSAPEVTQEEDDQLYRQATIDVASLQFILQSRGWKLPTVSYEQTEQLVSRLRNGSSPDFYGLTSEHIKYGGATAILFLHLTSTSRFNLLNMEFLRRIFSAQLL